MANRRWTTFEIDFLKESLSAGLSAREMRINSRTQAAIQNKAVRLGLIGDGISRRQWSKEHEDILRKLIGRGLTPTRIFAKKVLPSYSKSAIMSKVSRLGLVNPEKSRKIRARIRLTTAQQDLIKLFLNEHASTKTPEEISLLWNSSHEFEISHRQVIYYLRQLKIKFPWRVIMSMPYSKKKQRRRSEQCVTSQNKRWTSYRKRLKQRLTELARKLRKKLGRNFTSRTCSCGARWPACEPFFTTRHKTSRTGAHAYLGRICPLCRNEKRRNKWQQKKAEEQKMLEMFR